MSIKPYKHLISILQVKTIIKLPSLQSNGVYRMVGMDAGNYPTMPQISDAKSIVLNSSILSTSIEYTLFLRS